MDTTIEILHYMSICDRKILTAYLSLLVAASVFYFSRKKKQTGFLKLEQPNTRRHGIDLHKTQVLRCNVSHCRMFPKKHRFSYPYLAVGVPVRSPRSNWLLSVDTNVWWKRGWLHVSAEDHLNRGRDGISLSENIDSYMKMQVHIITPNDPKT